MATSTIPKSEISLRSQNRLGIVQTSSITLSESINHYYFVELIMVDANNICLSTLLIPTELILNPITQAFPSYTSDSQTVKYLTFTSDTTIGGVSGSSNVKVYVYGVMKK